MMVDETGSVARFPTRFLSVAVILTGAMLVWLGWGAYHSYQLIKTIEQRDHRIEQLRGRIIYLDEVLTMSARMAAATGEPQWEERYRRYEPELDAVIKQAAALAPKAYADVVTAQTDAANVKLVEMENRAFGLVRQGRLEEARSVLSSDEYDTQKQIYADGMTRLADLLSDATSNTLRSEQRRAFWGIILVLLAVLGLLVGWLVVLRATRRWRETLLSGNRQLVQQASELGQLNRALDQRIEQLEREVAERKRAEGRVQHLNAVLRAIRNVNQLISREKDRDRLLQGACASLTEARGYRGTWIALLGESRRLVAAAEAKFGEDFQPLVERLKRGELNEYQQAALSQSGVLLIDGSSSALGDCPLAGAYRDGRVMAARLEYAGKVCGVMVASTHGDFADDEEEQRLFEEVAGDVAFALDSIRLEEEHRRAEEALRLEQSRLEALLQLNQMTEAPMQDIAEFALEEAVRLTGSQIGYLAFMNDDETVLTMHAWSKAAMQQCAVIDKPIVYPVETTGLWGEAVRQREPVITNDYSAPNPLKKGYPEGHVEVTRHMNVPVFDGQRIVAVAGVGNKAAPYDESDVRELTLLMQGMWRLVQRKRAEEELRRAHDELELRVQKRTAELASANEELKREVAERKQAEKDLAYERFLLATLMDHSPDYIYFKDAQSRFIRISRALAGYFGLGDPSEAIGKSDFDVFDAERAGQYLADEQEVMRTGKTVVGKEEEQPWPDGRVTWVSTSKVPLRSPEGDTIGTFGISRDITGRKRAEAQLQAAKEAAEAANRAKSDFLANMSHEIRTPMNAIIGMTELVLDTDLTGAQRDYLRMVRESGESLLSVINDVLDFSKIEAGKLDLESAPFDLRESLGDTMRSLALRAHTKGLELACHIQPSVPDRLVGDAGRLRQIVVNLVGNAIKFTEAGEVVLAVQCRPESDHEAALHVTVTDTGIGIPQEKQATIFGAFEQADTSSTRKFGGTGLGLAISSSLVRLMNGRIWVESEVGRGSTFHFTARLELAGGDATAVAPEKPVILRDTPVLVVDDNATNRRILEEMLRNWGMKPSAVAGASEALAVLRRAYGAGEPFALVLTDANMPDVDGFALAEQIKRDTQLSSTVIMMLTSGDRPGDVTRCEQVGVAAYLLKPIKQSELFDAVAMALGITTPEDEVSQAAVTERPSRIRPLRVLLAEDSLVNQKLAVGLLEKHGHTVVVANHGREAIAAWESQPFDLVLMDVQMPEMDGFEATAVIRTKEKRTAAHIPIVAMTAHAMKGDRERCLEAGMDAYIAKPIRAQEVFDTIEAVLGGSAQAAAPPEQAPPGEQALDWSEALRAVKGDHALLQTVVAAVLQESPRMMRAVRRAIADGDAAALRLAAHTLKGSIRYFGPSPAYDHAVCLERMGEQGNLQNAQGILAALEKEMGRLTPLLLDLARTYRTAKNS